MNEPTPGPWRAELGGADAYVVCPDGRRFTIGDILDMLNALKRIAAWEFNIMGDCVADAQALANAVIKQAEGRLGGG